MRLPLLTAALLLAIAAPASAATFTVTTTADGAGSCSGATCPTLRAAITETNRLTGTNAIVLPAGTYALTSALPVVTNTLTITGASAVTTKISGNNTFRLLEVNTLRSLIVAHVTLTGGNANSGIGGDVLVDLNGTLTLDHSTVTAGAALHGGGITNQGTTYVIQSLVNGNSGNGIYNLGGNVAATLTVADSTIALNTGPGIESTGNVGNSVTITRSTIASNAANGLTNSSGTMTLSGSIVADNTSGNCSAAVGDGGGNADTGSTCGLAGATDRQKVSNSSHQLVANALTPAGETQVLAVPAGSVAIDLAGACSGSDQRDLLRPQGAACDAGAYEFDPVPDTRIDSGPPAVTGGSVAFTFSSADPAASFQCRLDGPGGTGTFVACSSPASFSGLGSGAYTFLVRATNLTGDVDATPASQAFTVDATAPAVSITGGPSGATDSGSPTFAFSSSDPGVTFQCKLDRPSGPGTFAPCVSPVAFRGLPAGAYVFSVRAIDAVGNATTTSRSFLVVLPTADKTVVGVVVKGKVLVRLKGKKTFAPLDPTKPIPLGSEIDTRKGTILLTAQPTKNGPTQSAQFFEGLFVVTQPGHVTQLQLSQTLACTASGRASAAAKKPKTRKLWGDGSGSFRTRGQYSAATVRGTKWLTQDSCGQTLTRVARGVVSVRDLVKHRTVIVRAPHRYIARAKR
jgi:hypothetical protein